MSYPLVHFPFCFFCISCAIGSGVTAPPQGIIGYSVACWLGYRLVRIIPVSIPSAGLGVDNSRLLLKLAHAASFPVDVVIAPFVVVYFCFSVSYILNFSFS